MAQPKSKRRSRKRHKPGAASPPAPVKRRERAVARQATSGTTAARGAASTRANPLRAYGEPPRSPFGGVPVSEIAIAAGAVAFVVGVVGSNPVAAIVGMVICALAVLEFTAREHFSGYRSHTTLLAAFPAVALEGGLILLIKPRYPALMLVAMGPVYALAFWFLRRRFLAARQLRLARPPAP